MSQSGRRALTVGATLLALLALVGLASRGHLAGAGGGPTRHVSIGPVAEYLLLVLVLGALLLMPVFAIAYRQAKDDPSLLPSRGNWMKRVFLTMLMASVAALSYLLYRLHQHHGGGGAAHPGKILSNLERSRHPAAEVVEFDWVPVIVVFSIAAAGAAVAGAYYLRTRKQRSTETDTAAALGEALDESLDDLRREPDSRRAVIAAYARMERALAASGVPRRPAEAPLEYLTRVLRDLLRASAASVARLTALFERAKFSTHEIGADLKEEAIEALVAVRDELRNYA